MVEDKGILNMGNWLEIGLYLVRVMVDFKMLIVCYIVGRIADDENR